MVLKIMTFEALNDFSVITFSGVNLKKTKLQIRLNNFYNLSNDQIIEIKTIE